MFVFDHSPYAKEYLTQALFGDSNFFTTGDDFVLEADGLFSVEQWRNISACYLARVNPVNPEARVIFPFAWKNPRALSEIPKPVLEALS
ncbi:MAG: hypothetical protein FJ117_19355 [Deltaproteobacteria bacterium]|nr:hypothetical protein [Deltaproteobacteria bacterium]